MAASPPCRWWWRCFTGRALQGGGLWLRWVALAIFVPAGVTDFFDGYLARAWEQQSSLGRMLDPIADKLLVSSCLLMLAAEETIHGWSLLAAVIILCREILVSGLREFLAELRVSVPVTRLAKWKTIGQLVAIGFLIAGAGRRPGRSRVTRRSASSLLWALGAPHALYRLGLYARRPALRDRGMNVKSRYFAWVRERVGKPEEEVELPAGGRHRRRADGLARRARRGICPCLREPEGDPRGHRPRPCAARRARSARRAKSPFSRR